MLPVVFYNLHTSVLVSTSYCSFQTMLPICSYNTKVCSSIEQQPQNLHPATGSRSDQCGALSTERKTKSCFHVA